MKESLFLENNKKNKRIYAKTIILINTQKPGYYQSTTTRPLGLLGRNYGDEEVGKLNLAS